MKVYYKPPFGKSAKKLAAEMGLTPSRVRGTVGDAEGIAWGTRAVGALNGNISVGKLYQLDKWVDADLRTIPYQVEKKEGWLPRGSGHFGGSDFEGFGFRPSYYTKPIKSKAEYRLHVFRYKGKAGNPSNYMVARVGWKVNEHPEQNTSAEGVPIRSRQFGWRIHYYNDNNCMAWVGEHKKADLLARWAVASLGWDFGAVDVLKGEDGKYYLLEANSAPGLSDDATLKVYARRLGAIVGR